MSQVISKCCVLIHLIVTPSHYNWRSSAYGLARRCTSLTKEVGPPGVWSGAGFCLPRRFVPLMVEHLYRRVWYMEVAFYLVLPCPPAAEDPPGGQRRKEGWSEYRKVGRWSDPRVPFFRNLVLFILLPPQPSTPRASWCLVTLSQMQAKWSLAFLSFPWPPKQFTS